jgi:hypothetical protein
MSFGKRGTETESGRPRSGGWNATPEPEPANPFGLQNQARYDRFDNLANRWGLRLFVGIMLFGAVMTFGVPMLLGSLAPASLVKGLAFAKENAWVAYVGIAFCLILIGASFATFALRAIARISKPRVTPTTNYSSEQIFFIYLGAVVAGLVFFFVHTGADISDLVKPEFWSLDSGTFVRLSDGQKSAAVANPDVNMMVLFGHMVLPLLVAYAIVYGWKQAIERMKDIH